MNLILFERRPNLTRQSGQSLMEYAVVCGVLAFILFVPITDAASPAGARTTAELVAEGFLLAYQKFSYAISIPT